MKKREAGQAFILVLIILAIGTLLVVPALKLTDTSLRSSRVVAKEVNALYAADGAQEYVLWMLLYDGLGANFTYDGDNVTFQCDVCGTPVDILLIMRAVASEGGLVLATDDVVRPTKTVTPDTVPDGTFRTYTYTIRLEQLSDNNTQGLDAVYDILPKSFGTGSYESGSSYLRVDGGEWESIGDPLAESSGYGGQERLRWPNPATYGSENFTSPIRDFEVRQVKELKFQVAGTLLDNKVHCNWVVLKPWDTVSGPQAPISVGGPANPGVCSEDGLLTVTKYSDPQVIQPGVVADVKYTINITNLDGFTHSIEEITDYLPAGFTYTDNSTSGLTTLNPQQSLENLNGVDRWKLTWAAPELPPAGHISVASDETLTLTFWVTTTKDVSGSYYNEVEVLSDVPVPKIFSDIGLFEGDYFISYSWNTGAVIVPAYDSQSDAGEVLIDANMALILGGIAITSWQIY